MRSVAYSPAGGQLLVAPPLCREAISGPTVCIIFINDADDKTERTLRKFAHDRNLGGVVDEIRPGAALCCT